MNKELKLVDSKINYNFQLNSNISNNTNSNSSLNNFNQNFFPQNNSSTSSIDSLGSTIYPEIYKDKINKNQQNQNSKSSNSQNEKYESVNSNISIFNIVHNYNNYNVNQPLTTEKIAKNFLIELFQKPHPQWKINSNSIKILNNNPIGIGGLLVCKKFIPIDISNKIFILKFQDKNIFFFLYKRSNKFPPEQYSVTIEILFNSVIAPINKTKLGCLNINNEETSL